jgi:phosphoglycerate kinase
LFVSDCIGKKLKMLQQDYTGVLLLENLRFHSEEEAGDVAFAKQLAALGDIM